MPSRLHISIFSSIYCRNEELSLLKAIYFTERKMSELAPLLLIKKNISRGLLTSFF